MRVTVTDMVSPSYLVAIAAVELGFFRAEGIDAEFVVARGDGMDDLRTGEIDFLGGSANQENSQLPNLRRRPGRSGF